MTTKMILPTGTKAPDADLLDGIDSLLLLTTSHPAAAITGFGTTGSATLVSRNDHTHTGTYEPANTNIQTHIAAATGAEHGAVSANTVNMIVRRDSSGNFSAGTITASLSGNATTAGKWFAARNITFTGNMTGTTSFDGSSDITIVTTVGTATALATARNIILTGAVTGTATFNGSADASIATTAAAIPWSAITSGKPTTVAGYGITDASLSTHNHAGVYEPANANIQTHVAAVTGAEHGAVSANTANMIVRRDGSGNFSAGTITATLSGNASTATTATNLSGGTVSATTGTFSGLITPNGGISYVKNATNTVSSNLGSPSVEEMALLHGEFSNKFRFTPASLQEESTDGITWITSTRLTANNLADLMIGEGNTTVATAIPAPLVGGSGYYRLTWNSTAYYYLNAFYAYCSTSGNTITFTIEKRLATTQVWSTVATGNTNNWPGHVYIPHSNIPFSTALDGVHYDAIRITFAITSAAYANAFTLYAIEWLGGYPAGLRNVQTYDRNKNVFWPAGLSATTGTFTGTVTAPTFSGNATTATTLQTARNIILTGAVTGTVSFNGSADASITTTAVAIPWSAITSGKPTTVAGYGITDASLSTHNHAGVYEPANANIQTHIASAHAPATAITAAGVTYANLNTNGSVGTGSTQVAIGNHTHSGVYEPANANIQNHIASAHAPATAITATGVTYANLNTNGSVGTGATQVAFGNHNHDTVYAKITTPVVASALNTIDYPSSAALNINTSAQTGTIKITLPYSWNSTMIYVEIAGYDYSTNGSFKLLLGGYNYSVTPGWTCTSALIEGNCPATSVRFGHDGTKCCILLGTTSTVWQYPKLAIVRVMVSFGTLTGWETGWTTSLITSETGITVTATNNIYNEITGITAAQYGSTTQVPQITLNAEGRVSAVNNQSIAFPVTSVAGKTGVVSLGALTNGSGITTLSYDGSTAKSIVVDFGTGATQAATGNHTHINDVTIGGPYMLQTHAANSITGLSSTTPSMNGTAAVGTGTTVARADHVHGSDTTKANIAQTMYIGTTALAINRASAALALTGITSIDGNAATATNISNTGTVTLATSTESNAITITAPAYSADTPVKLLNFNWYTDAWSIGNIRSSSTPSNGLGLYLNSVEKFRFIDGTLKIGANTALHSGNYNSYSPTLTGTGASGSWGINITGSASTVTTAAQPAITSVGTLTSLAVTGAITGASFNSITGLSSTTPNANGTATVGTGTTAARADHIHPTTGLMLTTHAANSITGFGTTTAALGTSAAGVSTLVSRADHVHPTTGLVLLDGTQIMTGSLKTAAVDGLGIGFWAGAPQTYGIWMGTAATYGRVSTETTSDYNTYFAMSSGVGRGFVFKYGTTPVAQIDGTGVIHAENGFRTKKFAIQYNSTEDSLDFIYN